MHNYKKGFLLNLNNGMTAYSAAARIKLKACSQHRSCGSEGTNGPLPPEKTGLSDDCQYRMNVCAPFSKQWPQLIQTEFLTASIQLHAALYSATCHLISDTSHIISNRENQ